MQSVYDHFVANGVAKSKLSADSWGEKKSFGALENDEKDRAVIIVVVKQLLPLPPKLPTPPVPSKPPTPPKPLPTPKPKPEIPRPVKTTQFRIRLITAVTTKWSITASFAIEDKVFFDRQIYNYKGIGLPFLPGVPYSLATGGGWNDLKTKFAATIRDFNGSMDFESYYFPPPKFPPNAKPLVDRTIVLLKCSAGHFKWWRFDTGQSLSAGGISFFKGEFSRFGPVRKSRKK